MGELDQASRFILITVDGDATLLQAVSFFGREELSRPYQFDLELTSKNPVDTNAVLGKPVTVTLQCPDPAGGSQPVPRYFNGIVGEFVFTGIAHAQDPTKRRHKYRATLVPSFWKPTFLRPHWRSFLQMTGSDIVHKLLQEVGVSPDLEDTSENFDYVLQAGESDFDFMSRLLAEHGLFYYFSHADSRETLHIAKAHGDSTGTLDFEQDIQTWSSQEHAVPDQVTAYGWDRKNKRDLTGQSRGTQPTGQNQLEEYPYTAIVSAANSQAHTELYATSLRRALRGQAALYKTTTTATHLSPGHTFKLKSHPTASQNQEYLVISAVYQAGPNEYDSGGEGVQESYAFSTNVTAVEATCDYMPPHTAQRPRIFGPQFGIVTNYNDPDEMGRVKVALPGFPVSTGDSGPLETHWAPVVHFWAGKKQGAWFIPQVGQEVIVEFIGGDPDRPIVVGMVYNGKDKPPYTAADFESAVDRFSLKSSKGVEVLIEEKDGGSGDGPADGTRLALITPKDMTIRVDQSQYTEILKERHVTIADKDYEEAKQDKHLTVGQDLIQSVQSTASLEAQQEIQMKAGTKAALETGTELHLKGGVNLIVEGGTSVSIKCGSGAFINVGPAGISLSDGAGGFLSMVGGMVTLVGTMLSLNGGGSPGSAGSGSGASPASAEKPKVLKAPKPAELPQATQAQSAAAKVLQQSSKSGAPFCEKCAETLANALGGL